MIEELTAQAEILAQKAEKLPAFDKVNLRGIKREVERLLGLIGGNGIFDEYTKHDISHVDKAIKSLDWLIPKDTAKLMTPADWLLTVLGIYFHDIGMLVTKNELSQLDKSGFEQYRDSQLFGGDRGESYKAKVEQLEPEAATRFLYEEYVRHHHATRIRDWVTQKAPPVKGVTKKTMQVIDDLLSPLGTPFRRDLGMICESHHLDDLTKFEKYKISEPYGDSPAETANVHYAALLLRTADLLHVTQDRTPSIVYRIIDPADPISQDEWAKQMGVRSLRPKMGLNKDGVPDKDAPRDTIEVHALFTDERGFFGLTSYLSYAKEQLSKSHEASNLAQKKHGSQYHFPWQDIDSDGVEAVGFIPQPFEFTMDQAKVLDLLTGHTLYNDTSVVIRELAQNAIDAVRLQKTISEQEGLTTRDATVRIEWNTAERALTVTDTGTGMSQGTIEKHFLKVGASRYQDEEFKKDFPEFSPISRFGIGILSAFMVADEVEVITVSEDEDEARKIWLRALHGRYLVRLLAKDSAEVADLVPHGTSIKLKIRRGAKVLDVIEAARRWIVIPRCDVSVSIDGAQPVVIGFDSPKAALVAALQEQGYRIDDGESDKSKRVRVIERQADGVTLAIALEWSPYFREWEFLDLQDRRFFGGHLQDELSDETSWHGPLLGTCLEGIRVDNSTPGYLGQVVWAIVNSEGPSSPRTNVARSGLEATSERLALLRQVYGIFCSHVEDEMEKLRTERGYSDTWAAREASYLIRPLVSTRALLDESLWIAAASELPFNLLETGGIRRPTSPNELASLTEFWTVHCTAVQSAETLVRELPGSGSLTGFLNSLDSDMIKLPGDRILCGLSTRSGIYKYALANREISEIRAYPTQRRADLKWEVQAEDPRWKLLDISRAILSEVTSTLKGEEIYVGTQEITTSGLDGYDAVGVLGDVYYLYGTPLSEYLLDLQKDTSRDDWSSAATLYSVQLLSGRTEVPTSEDALRESFSSLFERTGVRLLAANDVSTLLHTLADSSMLLFNPFEWSRDQY